MNGITHGFGVVFAFAGSVLLSNRVKDLSTTHVVSCAVYSTSLIVLYTSSTLYHSFFSMQNTKYIFEVLDKCAIYILIAGSYTPFLQVAGQSLGDWGKYLLAFIWTCCVCGITVEAFYPVWAYKGLFSLAMYLGMGWSCVVCLPELVGILPPHAVNLLVLGGVGYTAGVPFFVRNNNLDHSIFHLFVLAGSIFHWLGIYWYLPQLA
jgi:hemolysin III